MEVGCDKSIVPTIFESDKSTAFMHHGQICFSTERIVIPESISEQFIGLLKQKAEGFAPGSGVSHDVVQKAHDRLVEAKEKDATFILARPHYTGPAELLPMIVTGVTKNMALFDIESFGPSVSVYVVKDDEEAVAAANNSDCGLNASIHTRDMISSNPSRPSTRIWAGTRKLIDSIQ